jgi:dTDP-4-amino-4,6-dideoxygalactose transaminase
VDRGAVAKSLRAAGVQCNFGTYASHRQPIYKSTQHCPVSSTLFDRHLAIPMHANLSERDVEHVTSALRTALDQ